MYTQVGDANAKLGHLFKTKVEMMLIMIRYINSAILTVAQ